MLGSPRVSMLAMPLPAAAAISTAAEPPIVADAVGTKATPTAGVIPMGSPTACHCARVAVPSDTIMLATWIVVAVNGVPDTGLTLESKPLRERL